MRRQVDEHHADDEDQADEREQALEVRAECASEAEHKPDKTSLDDDDREEREEMLKDVRHISEAVHVDRITADTAQQGDCEHDGGAAEDNIFARLLMCVLHRTNPFKGKAEAVG